MNSAVLRTLFEDMEGTASCKPIMDHGEGIDNAAKRKKGDGQPVDEVPVRGQVQGHDMTETLRSQQHAFPMRPMFTTTSCAGGRQLRGLGGGPQAAVPTM